MPTLLIQHAALLVTMDAQRREIPDGAVFARDGVIEAVGRSEDLPGAADEVIDAHRQLVMPGLVNTHHHMFQSLTRVLPAAQDCELFDWLRALYPVWARLTPEMVAASTRTAMVELLLSGCTTTSDHLYLFPNGCRLDDSIEAAVEIGLRFHAARGAMSVGQRQGGLPPDEVVEDEDAILRDMQRVIDRWHDPGRHAMLRIVVAPCSPFSVSQDLMRESARLARSYGAAHRVSLHTHLAENHKDVAYTRERFGCSPAEYAEQLGWLGPDVWHAHCVQLDAAGIAAFGSTGTGVSHCPGSNMRLGSGAAPVRAMLGAAVPVSIAVDGSASNDSGHLLGELRLALLLQRVGGAGVPLTAREVLEMATLGGARALNRDDIGALAPGMAADLIGIPLDTIGLTGALHDPVAALLFCQVPRVATSVVNGRVLVRGGELCHLELPRLTADHNRLAVELVAGR
jgi:cytosine/adenosine deaminase-related metal-dependent hydrolase